MERARIIFFGTPEFAVPSAEALRRSGRCPVLVVSQPPRPAGRGRRLRQPPVALWAEERELPVAQPASVRDRHFLRRLEQLEPDLAVVVAFGQIFRRRLLELPRWGCLNLHASLLPAYRGAAPIQAALVDGLERTGVSTMRMERGLDSGPVYLQAELEIGETETAPELSLRLAELGAELVVQTVEGLERGEIEAQPQDDSQASYAPRVVRADGIVDWNEPASRLVDRERAFTPWPGLSTRWREEAVKLFSLRAVSSSDPGAPPGSWLETEGESLVVGCGQGTAVAIARLQRPGRRALVAGDFLRGLSAEGPRRFEGRAG